MSSRNNWESKSSARERLKAEREKEAKRAKARRNAMVGGGIVVGIVVVGAAAIGISSAMAKNDKPVAAPAHTSGTNGTTVVYGSASAKHTLHLYEDPRCPICAAFEQANGAQVVKGADAGDYKIQYTFGTFIDNNSGGTGSMNALGAMGAALNVSEKAFIDYHTALYSKTNHPEETTDKFSDDSYLLKIADQVPELKGNAAFEKNVKDDKFGPWASKMSDAFNNNSDKVSATPTALVDGKTLKITGFNNPPEGIIPANQFLPELNKALGK